MPCAGIASNLCKIRYKCSVFSVLANPVKYISVMFYTEELSPAARFDRLTDLLKFRAELKINVFVLTSAEVNDPNVETLIMKSMFVSRIHC